jgi:hypothetical protein
MGVWVDPRAGMDNLEKRKFLALSGLELRTLNPQAHSQSLYRLHHPGSLMETVVSDGKCQIFLLHFQWVFHWFCELELLGEENSVVCSIHTIPEFF